GDMEVSALGRYAYKYLTRDRARALYITPLPPSRRAVGGRTGVGGSEDDEQVLARFPQYTADQIRALARPPGFSSFPSQTVGNGLEVVVAPSSTIPVVTVQLGLHGGRASARPGVPELTRFVARPHSSRHGNLFEYGATRRENIEEDSWDLQSRAGSGNLGNL